MIYSRKGSLFFLVLLLVVVNGQQGKIAFPENTVGTILNGTASSATDGKSFHYIKINQLQKKYLFFKVIPQDESQAGTIGITVYEKGKKQILKSCLQTAYDTCYLTNEKLNPNSILLVVIGCQNNCRYTLSTYWADLQHLRPDTKQKFAFQEKDPTQIFHMNLKGQEFQQIRIILKPQTHRVPFDNVKIFVNFGLNSSPPTPKNYDLKSVHVWDEAQAIFLTKKQLQNYEGIIIYIVGTTKTVYSLQCQKITKDHNDIELGETLNEYIEAGKETYYHMKLKNDEKIDEYSMKFSVFTGEISIGSFYDRKFQNKIMIPPAQYQSDIQILFEREQLKENTTQIFVRVHSSDVASTYMITFQGRKKTKAHEIQPFVYEFLFVKNKTAVYFFDYLWNDNEDFQSEPQATYNLRIINVEGQAPFQIRYCEKDTQLIDCVDLQNNNYLQHTHKISQIQSISEIGLNRLYKIKINKNNFSSINKVEKRITFMIVFQSPRALVAIEYSNEDRMRLLRDSRVVEEKINEFQVKYYKYTNNDPNVKKISVNVNVISGSLDVKGKRQDFRTNSPSTLETHPNQISTITVTENITQPLYIKVFGIANSIYTISVIAEHESHPFSSTLTIAEDVQYRLKLAPGEMVNLQMNLAYDNFRFEYQSQGGPVMAFFIDDQGSVMNPSEQLVGQNQGTLTNHQSAHFKIIRLHNYGSDYNVIVKVIFHTGNNSHCEERKIDQIYNEKVISGQCFKFTLPIAEDIEVTTTRTDLGESIQIFTVCSKSIQLSTKNQIRYIPGSVLLQECKKTPNDIVVTMLIADKGLKKNQQIKLQYILEYSDSIITMKDGIAYNAKGISKTGVTRTFFYNIINAKDTQVILLNKKGIQKFLATIRKKGQQFIKISNSVNYASDASNYYSNPTIRISAQNITNANCGSNCVLIVNILSSQKEGAQIEYGIQITQNSVVLNEDEIRKDFLALGSVDYYEYQNRFEDKTLVVSLSTNNRHCGKIYLSNKEYPSTSNQLLVENGNELIYEHPKKQRYYIAVEAVEDCPYSISISQSDTKITRINSGQLYDIELKAQQRRYFIARHISAESFKIIAIQRHGTIIMYANRTQLTKQIIDKIKSNSLKEEDFEFKSSYKNSLYFDKNDSKFCSDCYYLIMIVAQNYTQSSLFMGDERSVIPIGDKILFDEIHYQNASTLAKFYNVKPGVLFIKVHAGTIEIILSYKNQTTQFKHSADKKVQREKYSFVKEANDFSPINIKITALEVPCLYSIELKPDSAPSSVQTYSVRPGQTTYIFLDLEKTGCLRGYLNKKDQQIILSTSVENVEKFKNLTFEAKIDGNKNIKLIKEEVGNIIVIKFEINNVYIDKALSYELCVKNKNQTISFLAFQSANFNLLPPDAQTLIRNQEKFVLHPHGNLILDLFECKGKAQIKYSSEAQKLQTATQKSLDVIGMPGQPHAIKIQQYSTIFLDVKGQLSTFLWMPMNETEERGLGYFNFEIGSLTYNNQYKDIQFNVQGLKKIKQTKAKFISASYILYISNNKDSLKAAVMCERTPPSDVLVHYVGVYGSSKLNKIIKSRIQKDKVLSKFSDESTLYLNVVADMILEVPLQDRNTTEHYKFIYYEQQIPVEVFNQLTLENMNLQLKISLGIVIVVGFLLIGYVFIRWIVPAIGKLKNRVLVEEAEERKDQSIPVPPSSDRNQIEKPETQEQMN